MSAGKTILINTLAGYGRSLVAVGLALFSNRWILQSLGARDYGLYFLVGSIVLFVTFISTVTAGGVGRFYSMAIGRDDAAELKRWFNTALTVYCCLAFFLLAVGLIGGDLIIAHFLTIPADRLNACRATFHASLVPAFFSVLAVPFVAMFNAKQKIVEISVWGSIQVLLAFLLALWMPSAMGDRLVVFAVWMAVITSAVQVVQIFRCLILFAEAKIDFGEWIDVSRMKELFVYTAFYIIDSAGALLRGQGTAILMNVSFGPIVNAGYGIANQVSVQVSQLSGSLLAAFSPEIIACEGRGDREKIKSLVLRANNLGTILLCIMAIPLLFEMDYVLKLWLKMPPLYAAGFCRAIMIAFIVDRLSTGNLFAINASGRIAGYQMSVGVLQLLTLPLTWGLIKMGYSPDIALSAFVVTSIAITLGRLYWSLVILDMQPLDWFRQTFLPLIISSLGASILPVCIILIMQTSFVRLILLTVASVFAFLTCAWYIVLTTNDRNSVMIALQAKFHKMAV